MPFVYILKCSDDTYYTGYTVDIDHRLEEHQKGMASKYTRGRTPVELVYLEQCSTKGEALKREIKLKKLTRDAKVALIEQTKSTSR